MAQQNKTLSLKKEKQYVLITYAVSNLTHGTHTVASEIVCEEGKVDLGEWLLDKHNGNVNRDYHILHVISLTEEQAVNLAPFYG